MCGIAGIVMRNEATPDPAVLDALERALAHRGPDGSGRHVNGAVGLLQTRLAIIDLATGDQPLHARGPSGGLISLVANGEIYNYRELRREFPDGTFETQSDCETPLHLYLRDGVEYARGLRGMYAIALHDPQTDRLVLSRDPFGIKPLYYIETGETFAFASEAQALVRAGLAAPNVDTVKARELLQLQFTTGDGLPVAGIKRVLPGETLVIRAGRIIERYRIAALPPAGHRALEPRAAINELMAVLEDSVEMHQRADVPYGMFLSGGIDSSALLAMMDKLNDKPVQAFTVGFGGAGGVPDERDHARAVAKAAHAEHTEIQFGEDDFWSLAPKVAAALDDPVADYAALPTFKLAETVKQAGLKVILSGEGGDEMFAGYGRYRRAARPWILGGRRTQLAQRHRTCRGGRAEWRQRSATGTGHRLRRLAAQRPADQGGSLPDGTRDRGAGAVPGPNGGGLRLSARRPPQGARTPGKMAAPQVVGDGAAGKPAVQPQARFHGAGGNMAASQGRAARPAGGRAGGHPGTLPPGHRPGPVRRRRQALRPGAMGSFVLRALAPAPHPRPPGRR
jgi:asparagine synthase (glutamine-hydrolysing)